MSSFVLAPVEEPDFERMLRYTDEAGGTLAAPIMFESWPATDPEATARRNAWSINQQHWQFLNDPTARFMKVEDTSSGEIVSLARWHCYSDGYPQEDGYTEIDVFAPPGSTPSFPEGLHGPIHAGILGEAVRRRADYVKPGLCWSWRRKGAGGLLIRWGAEQAAKDGVPAYIEALPTAKKTYEGHGFKHVEDSKFDCSQWGMEEEFMFAIMRKDP